MTHFGLRLSATSSSSSSWVEWWPSRTHAFLVVMESSCDSGQVHLSSLPTRTTVTLRVRFSHYDARWLTSMAFATNDGMSSSSLGVTSSFGTRTCPALVRRLEVDYNSVNRIHPLTFGHHLPCAEPGILTVWIKEVRMFQRMIVLPPGQLTERCDHTAVYRRQMSDYPEWMYYPSHEEPPPCGR